MKQEEWFNRGFALTVNCFMLYMAAIYKLGYSITWWVVVLVVVLSPVIPGIVVGGWLIISNPRKYKEK